jgi:hypothetical protein
MDRSRTVAGIRDFPMEKKLFNLDLAGFATIWLDSLRAETGEHGTGGRRSHV